MGPGDLKQVISNLVPTDKNIVVGFEKSEDAAVYKINENEAIVQTLDFITPVVDDPYLYGQIAAANSLSDVFAMGAEVKTAMNIVGFDKCNLPTEALGEILRGGNDKIKECGGVLLGGHTIESPEMYYGLSVTGIIHPKDVLRNNTARAGDVLVLTKPLGMGILTTAIKRDLLDEGHMEEAVKIMAALNHKTSQIMREYRVNACTDITGFGLLGHAMESCNDDITLCIDSGNTPILDIAKVKANEKIIPGGTIKNQKYLEEMIDFKSELDFATKTILFDAQTSGGLLVSIHKDDAPEFLSKIQDLTFGYAKIIGEVLPKQEKSIQVF